MRSKLLVFLELSFADSNFFLLSFVLCLTDVLVQRQRSQRISQENWTQTNRDSTEQDSTKMDSTNADINRIHLAACDGDIKTVKEQLDKNVNADIGERDGSHYSPLIYAVRNNNFDNRQAA